MNGSNNVLQNSTNILKEIGKTIFNTHTILVLLFVLVIAILLSKIISLLMLRLSRTIAIKADKTTDLASVNRLRRIETLLILSTAIVRVLIIIVALVFWWAFTHPGYSPSALIGASALVLVIAGGVLSPVLRDIAFGGSMMAEQWFGVGDLISIIPYDVEGVVEKVTLRSTKIRRLSGDALWISNQNIIAANIVSKGLRSLALEFYVNDINGAQELLRKVNCLLPTGPSLVVNPLTIMSSDKTDTQVWHVIALGATAPEREWLIEKNAIDIMKSQDAKSKRPILITEPIGRYADTTAEKLFAMAIHNAQKTATKHSIRLRRSKTKKKSDKQ